MTTPGGSPSSTPALLAVKNATVSVCSYPATLVSGMCTNTITTYTSSSEGTACPSSAQLTMPGSAVCVSQTDQQGSLGFWYDQGTNPHVVYTVKTTWGTFGPYDVSQPNATGLPLSGGTLTGALTGTSASFPSGVTATLTGHASLDLPLTGGTLSGSVAASQFNGPLNGNVTGNLTGSVTGHASLDLPLTGGALSGNFQVIAANPPLQSIGTSTVAPGLYLAPTWNGTTTGPLSSNVTFSALYLNHTYSRPGVNRGGLALTAPNWTANQLFSLNLDNYGQGLSNGAIGEYHRGLGDTLPLYTYAGSNGGAVLGDDEGTGAVSATTGEGRQPNFTAATYSGTVVTGGSGATQLSTTCGANCDTQGDGEYLLDLTSAQTDYFTAHTNASGNTPETITTNGTYTVSTAWGSLVANVNPPTTNPVGTGTSSQTFSVTLTSGTFTVGGLACFAGQLHDQGTVTAVGTPSGGVQSITVAMRQVHYAGSMVYEGGPCGKFAVVTAGKGDGLKYPVDVFGATAAHTLVVGAFGFSSWVNNYILTNVDLNSIGVSTLSNSGTTVTFTFSQGGFASYAGPFFGASAVTFSGASDSAFNTQCTSLSLNASTQVGTCTISGLTGTHTAASASVTLGDTGHGNTDFTLYSGAEILDVQHASAGNAVDGLAFTIEPNNAAWTAGDSIEAEHLPGAIFFAGKFTVTVHNPGVHVMQGLSATVSGAGAISSSLLAPPYGNLTAANTESWSNYQFFGGNTLPLPGLLVTGPNDGIDVADAPAWGGYGLHFGPPHSGVSTAGYFFYALTADCAAGTQGGACGLAFHPDTNTWQANNSSESYKFYGLQGWNAAANAFRTAQTWNGTTRTSGHLVDYDANGDTQDSGVALSGVCQSNGTNCPVSSTIGNVTLVAGTATATTSAACTVSGTCTYQLTNCGVSGTQGMLSVGTITAGTSFVINSSSNTDTSKVCWSILP
jgi:hypothetical protein